MKLFFWLFLFGVICVCFQPIQASFEHFNASSHLKIPRKGDIFRSIAQVAHDLKQYPVKVTYLPASKPIQPNEDSLIACAFSKHYLPKDAIAFAGTARKAGFKGNIIVAILPDTNKQVIETLLHFNVTLFEAQTTCSLFQNDINKRDYRCQLLSSSSSGSKDSPLIPVTLFRYVVYPHLLVSLAPFTKIILSDYSDVFFQSNPFKHKETQAINQPYQLAVFQESVPNRIVSRCADVIHHLISCYGEDIYRMIRYLPLSSSGVIIGHRDAIQVYSYLIVSQINSNQRHLLLQETSSTQGLRNELCLNYGVDQAFHNVLLYLQIFSQYLDVKIYPQGEGVVNVVGGFHGDKKLLRAYLKDWKILRGEKPYQYVYNWNGEISSIVHQLNRFMGNQIEGQYSDNLAVFQHMK